MFEFKIARFNEQKDIVDFEVISGKDLVEVLSKLMLTIVKIQDDMHDEELAKLRGVDDAISF